MRSSAWDRLWSKVVEGPNGCWLYTGSLSPRGYGQVNISVRPRVLGRAHRLAYRLLVGHIPSWLVIDHLCRVRNCVNPEHLEAVTPGENVRRGNNVNRSKVTCPQGHPYDDVNTTLFRGKWRRCKLCKSRADKNYKARKRLRAPVSVI